MRCTSQPKDPPHCSPPVDLSIEPHAHGHVCPGRRLHNKALALMAATQDLHLHARRRHCPRHRRRFRLGALPESMGADQHLQFTTSSIRSLQLLSIPSLHRSSARIDARSSLQSITVPSSRQLTWLSLSSSLPQREPVSTEREPVSTDASASRPQTSGITVIQSMQPALRIGSTARSFITTTPSDASGSAANPLESMPVLGFDLEIFPDRTSLFLSLVQRHLIKQPATGEAARATTLSAMALPRSVSLCCHGWRCSGA